MTAPPREPHALHLRDLFKVTRQGRGAAPCRLLILQQHVSSAEGPPQNSSPQNHLHNTALLPCRRASSIWAHQLLLQGTERKEGKERGRGGGEAVVVVVLVEGG